MLAVGDLRGTGGADASWGLVQSACCAAAGCLGRLLCGLGPPLLAVLSPLPFAVQILIAIAVIVITAVKLSKGSYVYTSLDFTTGEVTVERRHAQCFLSTSQDSDRACISMFILSGVSIAVSIALSCIYQMCCCLRYTCFCDFVDFVFAAAGFSWWLGGSVVSAGLGCRRVAVEPHAAAAGAAAAGAGPGGRQRLAATPGAGWVPAGAPCVHSSTIVLCLSADQRESAGVALSWQVMTRVVQSADAANVPQHYWRQDIMALIWSEVGLFALLLFAYFGTLLSNCCCCFDKQARLRSRARPVEERYQLAEHL